MRLTDRRWRLTLTIAAAVTSLMTQPVWSDPAEEQALTHLERGVAAFNAGDFPGARAELLAAQRLAPHKPNPYRWLALVEARLGDCDAALAHVADFVARAPANDPREGELRRLSDQCARGGALSVTSSPSSAAVSLDGAPLGVTPHREIGVRPGEHQLTVDKDGFERVTRSILVAAGAQTDVQLALRRRARPITRRWWFWAAAAAGSVAAASLAFYALHDPGRAPLPPLSCDDHGCRPRGGP
ncbi:MAG: PEGA domain-containing protein [Kofleriaceae bacterium]